MDLTPVYERLRHRDRAPRAFEAGRPRLAWEDPSFSREFYLLHTRDHGNTRVEVEALVEWLALRPGQRVLDLGCGGGRTLEALAERGILGAGIDIGPYPVDVARETLRSWSIPVVLGDMREEMPPGPFDAALCLFGQLTTFPEDEALAILKGAAQVLAPNGQLLLEMYIGPGLLQSIEELEEWAVVDRWMGGEYPQIVLDEHHVDWELMEYVRTSWAVAMSPEGPPLLRFTQGSLIYDEGRLNHLLAAAGFHLTALYGEWDGSSMDEDAPNLIAVARRFSGG